jgi:hypothetical protein
MPKPSDWQRKRDPDDVPTPVAVALSDFCRRAKSPASPRQVREALALLAADDDFRITDLAATEPVAFPLGPYAAVDIVSGTSADLAQRRQGSGYYELLSALVDEKQKKAPPLPPPPLAVFPPVASIVKTVMPAGESRGKMTKAERTQERILPKRMEDFGGFSDDETSPKFGAQFLPKRNLPAPRGRFSRVDPSKQSFESMLKAEARSTIEDIVKQSPHRYAALELLDASFSGKKGNPLSIEEVEEALLRHRLLSTLEERERQAIVEQLVAARGALGRAAYALEIPPKSLSRLGAVLGLEPRIDEIRSGFAKESIAGLPLSQRLELLSKTKYLADLKIEAKFQKALTRELNGLFDEVADAVETPAQALELVAKKHALHPESLRRATEVLRLHVAAKNA